MGAAATHAHHDLRHHTVAAMSNPSLAKFVVKRPWLNSWMKPLANWYSNAAGYRQLGLKCDDLIPEENDAVQLALKRLPPKEAYDRVFRIRPAIRCTSIAAQERVDKVRGGRPIPHTTHQRNRG